MPWRRALVRIGIALVLATALQAQGRWYPPYDRGVKAVEAKRWDEAIRSLEQALTIDGRPGANKYVEGVFRSDYFPHAYLAIACLGAGQHDKARAYLDRARQDRLPGPLVARLDTVQREIDALRRAAPVDKPVSEPPVAVKPGPEKPGDERAAPPERPAPEKPAATPDKPVPPRASDTGRAPGETGRPGADPAAVVRQAMADGETAYSAGRYRDAVARAREVLALAPGHAAAADLQRRAESRVLVDDGLALAGRGNYREAEAKFEIAAARDPGNADAAARLAGSRAFTAAVRQGLAAQEQGHLPAARAAFEDAARRDRARFDREGLARRLEAIVTALGSPEPSGGGGPAAAVLSDVEADALRRALRAIVAGDGAGAVTALEAALPSRSAPGSVEAPSAVHLRAYLAVAYAVVALSTPDERERDAHRQRATAEYARVLTVRPDFTLPVRLISPRVIEVLTSTAPGR